MRKLLTNFQSLPLELMFWCMALASLWWMDPYGHHFSLCILENIGVDWCPGCGLGRAMALLLKGEFSASWDKHPLAAFAFVVIVSRIFKIIHHLKTTHNYG